MWHKPCVVWYTFPTTLLPLIKMNNTIKNMAQAINALTQALEDISQNPQTSETENTQLENELMDRVDELIQEKNQYTSMYDECNLRLEEAEKQLSIAEVALARKDLDIIQLEEKINDLEGKLAETDTVKNDGPEAPEISEPVGEVDDKEEDGISLSSPEEDELPTKLTGEGGLKEYAKNMGLKTSGSKAEVLDRILEARKVIAGEKSTLSPSDVDLNVKDPFSELSGPDEMPAPEAEPLDGLENIAGLRL